MLSGLGLEDMHAETTGQCICTFGCPHQGPDTNLDQVNPCQVTDPRLGFESGKGATSQQSAGRLAALVVSRGGELKFCLRDARELSKKLCSCDGVEWYGGRVGFPGVPGVGAV